jgi:hypothetical protein
MKTGVPILVLAGAAGVWLGIVLVIFRVFGIHIF